MIALLFWLSSGLILYTYAGYPLLLWLLARLRPAVPMYPPCTPTVTLLITAYNEESVLGDKLENSLNLDYPSEKLQILVAADGSTDRTVEIARRYSHRGVEANHSPARLGKMAAILHAIPLARGEVVVFSDANNYYNRDALKNLAAPFADPSIGAASGAKTIQSGDGALGESEGAYWRYESFIKEQETRLGCCTGVCGEILAIRRCLITAPPPGTINDDFALAMQVIRQGHRLIYIPSARSVERVSASAKDEMARRARIVAGRYQALLRAPQWMPSNRPLVLWQILSHKILRPLVPFAMILALLSNFLLVVWPLAGIGFFRWPTRSFYGLLAGLQAIFYSIAILGSLFEKKGPGFLYLPTFLVNSNLAALAGLYRYLTGKQPAHWQRVARRSENL